MDSHGVVTGTPTLQGLFGAVIFLGDTSGSPFPVVIGTCIIAINLSGQEFPRGGRPYQVGPPVECKPPNEWDRCLEREEPRLLRIRPQPPCSVPQHLWDVVPWHPDFGSIPGPAVPFKQIHSITTPSTPGDTLVTRLITPLGYDGIITGLYWRYNGSGFVEGSGDIVWRVRINNDRFAKDLGNVSLTLGSPATPMPFTGGGQLLQSGQAVSILVDVPNAGGGVQTGPGSTINAGLIGFWWPKGVPGWVTSPVT